MKKKMVLVLLLAAAAAVIAAQVWLDRSVGRAVRERVLPALREELGAEVSVGGVGVSLWSGAILLQNVRVGNPAGYDEAEFLAVESCRVQVGLASLFRGRAADIRDLILRGVRVTLVRDRSGVFNVARLAAARGGRGRRAGAVPPPAGGVAAILPRLSVASGLIEGRLRLVDHAAGPDPFTLDLDMQTTLREVSTWGEPTNLAGRVTLEASQAGNPDVFGVLLHARLAPVLDPARPTAEVSGNLEAVPVKPLAPYFQEVGLEEGVVSGALRLVCRLGELDPKGSGLELTILGPKLSDPARARLGSLAVPETFKMTLPITGSAWAPHVDFQEAWKKALASGENLGAILQATDKAQTNATDVIRNLLERGR